MNKNTQPKVSIVIPTYNGSRYIEKTIRSVIEQTYENIELIVIDDCSTDNTIQIVNSLKQQLKNNFTVIMNEQNSGLMKTNNYAAQACTGDYLMILGHDDLLAKDHVSEMLSKFDRETVMLWCNSFVIDKNDDVVFLSLKPYLQKIKNLLVKPLLYQANFISSTGALIKADAFKAVNGFDENFLHFGEWSLWIKLASIGEIKFVDQPISFYRRHDLNMTSASNMDKAKTELSLFYNFCSNLAVSQLKLRFFEKLFLSLYKAFLSTKKFLKISTGK